MTTATFPIASFGLLRHVPGGLSANPKKITKAQRKSLAIERAENLSRPLVGMTDFEDILRYLELVESEFVATLVELADLATPEELKRIDQKGAYSALLDSVAVIEEMAGSEKHDQIVSIVQSMGAMTEWVNAQVNKAGHSDHAHSQAQLIAYSAAFSSHVRAVLGLIAVISMVNDDEPTWSTDSLMHLIDALDDLMDDAEVALIGIRSATYDLKESQPLSDLADVL